jgi:eukaryotic-like serine/threonine-protein kinase
LSDEYEWQLGSDNQVRLNGKNESIPIAILKSKLEKKDKGVKKQNIFDIMENPNRIIALGMASCEGSTIEEETRALNRARTIQEQIVKPLFDVKEYPMVNLGQFTTASCQRNAQGNSIQRKLVIIGMRKQSPGLEEKEVLYKRLGKTIKEIKLNDYSQGNLEKFNLITK